MGHRVKRVKTNVSEPQMAQAFINGWTSLFGTAPSKQQVGLLVAQNNLETGHRNSMWNYNVGNITTNGRDQFNYFDDLTTDEQIEPGKWEKKNLKYRAYDSLDDGVKDYLRLLSGKKYSEVWRHIVNPNPVAFSKSLKDAGYYTANEAPYTKNIVNLYKSFQNSDSYEQARSGNVSPANTQVAKNDNFFQNFLNRFKGVTMPQPNLQIDNLLNHYLQSVLASEKENKKLYKQYLTSNNAIVKINSEDYNNSIEFSRILSLAFKEELLANSFIHTDGKNVELSISIPGPSKISFEAVEELSQVVADAFEDATQKIGRIKIKTELITNKISSYQPISLKTAESEYRKFLLKFI